MKFSIILLSFTSTLFFACQKDSFDKDESCYSNSNAQSIVHDGIDREYVLYIPKSYDGTSKVPLMFNFHGFGSSASEFMNYADMRAVAESDTFILIYPQGTCADGSSHWNPCPLGGDNKSVAEDFGFIEAVLAKIATQYNIDMERIYAAGYSNGGMMAYGLANYKSDLIAAIGSVSGTMLDCIGSTQHPMPIIHLHGTSDDVIPYSGNNYYSSTQDVLDHWIDFNNTNPIPTKSTETNGGITIEHYVYGQGDSSVSVEHFKYIGGEHVWFSTTFQGQTTAELIWNFVSRYDINGLR